MILSRKHRFIFLHNPKAAGSSVTVSLARYLGPWDVQIGCHDEAMEDGIRPNLYSCVRCLHPKVGCGVIFMRRFLSFTLKQKLSIKKAYRQAFDGAVRLSWKHLFGVQTQHPYAKDVQTHFGSEWKNYLKFCVVRNPWDRVISDYHWRFRGKKNVPPFPEWVEAAFANFPDQRYKILDPRQFYRIDGNLAVNCVIKYENLSMDLQAVCHQIGLDWDGWLPTKKGNIRKDKDYRRFYDHKTRRCIA